MGVRLHGTSAVTLRRLAVAAVVLAVAAGAWLYLQGPRTIPVLHDAAAAECNDLTGGSYRDYRLEWVVGLRPHWECSERFPPGQPSVDLGWWVSP